MPIGEVGSGSQNAYQIVGTILEKHPRIAYQEFLTYEKEDRKKMKSHHSSACWTAGTPVQWTDNPQNAVAQTEAGVLASKTEQGTILEYHPLITFFNQVMFKLLQDKPKLLDTLTTAEEANAAMKYLREAYPYAFKS